MGTIAEKLAYTANAIDDIQAAIIEQGVEVGANVPLSDYGDKVRAISGGGPGPSPMPAASITIKAKSIDESGSEDVSETYTVDEAGLYFAVACHANWDGAAPTITSTASTTQYNYTGTNYAIKIFTCAVNDTISISYSANYNMNYYFIAKINGYTTIGELLERVDDYYEMNASISEYETNKKVLIYFGAMGYDSSADENYAWCYLGGADYNSISYAGSIDFPFCPILGYPGNSSYSQKGPLAGGLFIVDKEEVTYFSGGWESEAVSTGAYLAWEIS